MTSSFSDDQYELAYPQGIEYHWWSMARSWLIAHLVAPEHSSEAVFLEVGCGKGLEVKKLRDAGINVYGVELANVPPLVGLEEFVESGKAALELPLNDRERVTGLLLLDVIEHLPDPYEFLRSLEQGFPNLSVVIVTVPACQELWSNYDEFYGHHRRYSLQMLDDLSSRLGWRQEKAGYFFHLIYLPARLLALFDLDRSTRITPPATTWRWLHRLIAYLSRVEYFLLPQRTKGMSAFAVMRVK